MCGGGRSRNGEKKTRKKKNKTLDSLFFLSHLSVSLNRTPVESNFVVVSDHVCFRLSFFPTFSRAVWKRRGRRGRKRERKRERKKKKQLNFFFPCSNKQNKKLLDAGGPPALAARAHAGDAPRGGQLHRARYPRPGEFFQIPFFEFFFFFSLFGRERGRRRRKKNSTPQKQKKRLRSPRPPRPSPPPSGSRARPRA